MTDTGQKQPTSGPTPRDFAPPQKRLKKPDWLKIKMPGGKEYAGVKQILKALKLHTVCQEAMCPNLGECWGEGTATFMILGDTCTRGCRFCGVNRSSGPLALDKEEPKRIKAAVQKMNLSHAVITSVTRDDLQDGGASIFADTVRALKQIHPHPPAVEILMPDYKGKDLHTVLDAGPDAAAHNIETVERLTALLRHPRFSFSKSLETLRQIKEYNPRIRTKSSIMLGLGETEDEIKRAMESLLSAGVEILVLGQYLRPSRRNVEVERYLEIEVFERLAEHGRNMGFGFVAAHPLARTSHRAKEALAALRNDPKIKR